MKMISSVYTPDPSSNDIDADLERLLRRCNARAKERIAATALDPDAELVETYLINDGALQAYAAIEGGVNVVGIYLGAIFIVRDLFDQMLSHPSIFREIGNPSREVARADMNRSVGLSI
jgi:hypothetical protein